MDIVTLGAALNGSAEYVNSHFKGGSNIQIVDNPDGTQTINASGEVSSEDTVARAEIAAIKDGETLDSFGDVETALATKANADNVYKLALTNADLLPANTDLDDVKTVGCYYVYESVNVTTITHRPTGNTSAFRVTVELAAGRSRPRQIYQEFNSYERYMRYETSSGTWANWKKVECDLSTKQDTISDLSTIRSGAALGATAVQPETGKGLSTNDYTTVEKTKLAGIAEGAEVNVQSNWTQTTTTADDYIKNKPTLGTAAAKNATDTYNATGTDVTTGKAVAAALATLPEPMIFKGSLGTDGTITTLPTASSSNKGYVYKVITAGTYASQSAKVGDTFVSDGSAWVLIPSGDEPSGTVTNVAVANGGGLTVSGSPITSSGTITVGHSNSVTAKTSSSVKKFTYDAYGHVTGSSELSTAESDALASGIDSTKVEQIETNKNNISLLETKVNTNAGIISQTYNSTDCNISLILRQDSTEDLYVHYDTEARKLYMPYKVIKNQYKYWKDGVAYYKYHVLTEGVIMTNNSAKCNMLTSDTPEIANETYNRSWVATDDGGSAVTTAFNLSKANSEIGDVWYNRPYIIYDDLETGMRYKMYGPVYKITAGTPCTIECDTLSCTELTAAIRAIQALLANQ